MTSVPEKILIITPHYAPAERPRAYRWTRVAEYLVSQGHEVTVLCAKHIDAGNSRETLNGVQIIRTGYNSVKEIYYHWCKVSKRRGAVRQVWESSIDSAVSIAEATQTDKAGAFLNIFEKDLTQRKANRLNLLLLWLNNTFWRTIYWPDDACIWYKPALRTAKRLWNERGAFDTVISVSLPFTSHLVAHKLRKIFDFNWIVDIGDPFFLQKDYPVNNPFWHKKRNYYYEKTVLERADVVTVTNETVREAYINTFAIGSEKINVVPPIGGISPSPAMETLMRRILQWRKAESGRAIHIGYFGSFFKGVRIPDDFLRMADYWLRTAGETSAAIHFHFFGDIFDEFLPIFEMRTALKKQIHLYGLIPREMIPVFMETMDVLLNIGNQSNLHLPSKSADYIRSGKPILNFSYFRNDSFWVNVRNKTRCFNFDFSEGIINDDKIRALSEFVAACPAMEREKSTVLTDNVTTAGSPVAAMYLRWLVH